MVRRRARSRSSASSARALLATAVALQALGLAFAWNCRDAGSFHAVMNLLFMPMWLLSDAFFPVAGASQPLATIIRLNPLSWCGEWVRASLQAPHEAPPLAPALGAIAFAGACVVMATVVVGRSRRIAMGA
ncbi:MAG: ABC transporter permease [Phycisphaerales bacterium]